MAETMDSTFRTLASWLQELGLGNLFSYQNGVPRGWLWDQIQRGVTTEEELYINLSETPEFQARFPIIAEQQAEAARTGRPGYVMTPRDVLDYEQTVSKIMRNAGLPSTFYDEPSDFLSLMRNNLSADQVGDRINLAYDKIANAPQSVKDMFEEYFGVGQSDAALAAYVLDPEMVISRLERQRGIAATGAAARRYDIELSQQQAEDLVLLAGETGAQQGVANIGMQSGLFTESIGEAQDLTAQREGIAAEFGLDTGTSAVEAQTALDRRLRERQASQQSGGGAVVSQQGVIGLG